MESAEDIYQNIIHKYDVEIFSNMYLLENGLHGIELIRVLILINKFYPSYNYTAGSLKINKKDHEQIKWEEIVLNEYALEATPLLEMYFNIPVFVQVENQIKTIYTSDYGIGFILEKDERFGFVFIINIYPNVYLNLNSYRVFDESVYKWDEILIDQKIAATKNREILTCFLKELEALLKVEINGYESLKFDNECIFKYGFREI